MLALERLHLQPLMALPILSLLMMFGLVEDVCKQKMALSTTQTQKTKILIKMTPELQKYYESRFEMMGMEGWKELCIDIDNMIESLNNLSVIPDEKTLMFKKGELSILTWLKTLKEVSERAYEELNEKNV
jgi:hypothetical protein